ncbi:maleylpyruvate isomerase N-terminal domain-containing protein [Streptomyces sp. F-1]|uniref:maleylpyruvate isomerase N-terminal domain-containing protein n=1 Tax=Streptomyces sp. F-1 TaxID=463642 RepID=UPI0009A0E96F|nr:maleylpyruvate isomerase N-terminal domain-containing protein [Streptomyces sp. F-1]
MPADSPASLLPLLRTSVGRLPATAAVLSDEEVRAPSPLPGWTRGRVLTHPARSAGSRGRLLASARGGVDLPQYADEAQRAREIEEDAGQPAAVLLDDMDTALRRFLAAAGDHPADAWEVPVRCSAAASGRCAGSSGACCARWRSTTPTWRPVMARTAGPPCWSAASWRRPCGVCATTPAPRP